MIGVRINSEDEAVVPMFIFGVTKLNVEALTSGKPMKLDIEALGGQASVVVFYGETVDELRNEFAKIGTPDDLARMTSALDQLGAMEQEVRDRGK